MQKKQTILFVIDNLNKGGAEMLLVGILDDLQCMFNVVLVTLSEECNFDEQCFRNVTRYSMGVKSKFLYPKAIMGLKKIIKKHKPAIIHSHLVYSTIIASLAAPACIPLLFSVHNEIGRNVFKYSRILNILEKATIGKRQTLIAVSNAVVKDYLSHIDFKGSKIVLENYIGDDFYSDNLYHSIFTPGGPLKLIALGNIKHSKNYEYLVKSFISLKGQPISLDIYGKKDEQIYPALQVIIEQEGLPIAFKGIANNIPKLLPGYHIYVMSSIHEGFGIAVIEAMACGLPLLLSDLDVLKEVTLGNAIFFDLNDPNALVQKLGQILQGGHDLEKLSDKGIEISKKYSKQEYLQKLMAIYEKAQPGLQAMSN